MNVQSHAPSAAFTSQSPCGLETIVSDRSSPALIQLDQLKPQVLRQMALTETGDVVWQRSLADPDFDMTSSLCSSKQNKLSFKQKAHLKAAYYWRNHYIPGTDTARSQGLKGYVEAHEHFVQAGAWSLVEELLGELRSPLSLESSPSLHIQPKQKIQKSLAIAESKWRNSITANKGQTLITSWHEQLGEMGCYQEQVRIYRTTLEGRQWRDEQRLPLMLKLSEALTPLGQLQEAESFGQQALALAQHLRDFAQEAEAWGVLGCVLMYQSLLLQAISHFRRQLQLAHQLESPLLQVQAWVHLGKAHLHTNPQRSLGYYHEAEHCLTQLTETQANLTSQLQSGACQFCSLN